MNPGLPGPSLRIFRFLCRRPPPSVFGDIMPGPVESTIYNSAGGRRSYQKKWSVDKKTIHVRMSINEKIEN